MCWSCVEEEALNEGVPWDDGAYPPVPSEHWWLSLLITEWCSLDGNIVGGALHIVTDDANVGDSHLDFCRSEVAKRESDPDRIAMATKILDGLGAIESNYMRALVVVGRPREAWWA